MGTKITRISALDIRFPPAHSPKGPGGSNPDADNAVGYVILGTSQSDSLEGHGLTCTIGGGAGLWPMLVDALKSKVLGVELEAVVEDLAGFWRHVTDDGELWRTGLESGAFHLATAALTNAVWDLYAKSEAKPLWKILVDMSPAKLVSCIDFRYITDAITPEEALSILERQAPTRPAREAEMWRLGYPAYLACLGSPGHEGEKLRSLVRGASRAGWAQFKMKVGRDIDDDLCRAAIVREEIGPHGSLMINASQVWEVDEAIASIGRLAQFKPLWIEEPTSPDDLFGHVKIAHAIMPIGVATGKHCDSHVAVKQLLQANAISLCQPDSCRLRGVNECLAVMLMAAKFGVPISPHTAGIGLGEYAQHLSLVDYICISGSLQNRVLGYVDHLHEHFLDSVTVRDGRYRPPVKPGYSIQMKSDSLKAYAYPAGPAWHSG